MKAIKYILFCALLNCFLIVKAQDTLQFNGVRGLTDYVCQNIKNNYPNLTYFKYHLISSEGNIYDWYKGKNDGTDSLNFMLSYLSAVNNIESSNIKRGDTIISYNKLTKTMVSTLQGGLTPLSFCFVEYEDFKDSTVQLNLFDWSNNQFTETQISGYYPFCKKKFFMGSALNHVIKSPELKFVLSENLIMSNIRSQIDSVFINFNDSSGYRHINFNEVILVNYSTKGLKNCILKLKSNNQFYYSTFQIYDSTSVNTQNKFSSSAVDPDVGPVSISTTNSSGQLIKGRFATWFSGCNTTGKVRKPFIIVTGFNPGNGKQLTKFDIYPNDIVVNINGTTISIPVTFAWRGTYYEAYNGVFYKRTSPLETTNCGNAASNGNQFLDRLRDEGYDVTILMFDNGTDIAQNNAALIEGLINVINAEKFSNNSFIENVIAGYSMGAVSTRFALANMESKYKAGVAPHHHSKLWLSIEGEYQAANVPLGLQYFMDFQANPNFALPSFFGYVNGLQTAADWVCRISSNVAQSFNQNQGAFQLTAFTTASPNGPTAQRNNLLNDFNNLTGTFNGYPTFVRRVSVSNASNINIQMPHNSDKILDTKLKFNPIGDSYNTSDCKGSYTVYRPVSEKLMTARWWGSNNNQNIFDASVLINANWTYMQRQCLSGSTTIGVCPACVTTSFCKCIGPFVWAGQNANIANQHISKPTATINYDDPPASSLGAHLELYEGSAYPFYNNWFAGNSFANHDNKVHSFSPIVSTHDIRNPNTGLPVSNFIGVDNAPGGLNLLNIRKNNIGLLVQETDKRFGFPHLSYPSNHYQVTPFDGVYGIGINNSITSSCSGNLPVPKPENHFHNEDPQKFIGDYLARVEVAPTDLFLTNRIIGATATTNSGFVGNYTAEFEARNKIIAGKTDMGGLNNIYSLYNNQNFISANNDFKVAPTCKAIMHSGEFIELLPGFDVPLGAELDAFIQAYNCADLLFRVNNNNQSANNYSEPKHNLPNLGFNYDEPINKNVNKKINSFLLYPNPNNGSFTYVNVCNDEPTSLMLITNLEGKTVYQSSIFNNSPLDLNINHLKNGLYIVKGHLYLLTKCCEMPTRLDF